MASPYRRKKRFLRNTLTLFGLLGVGLVGIGAVWYLRLPDTSRLATEEPAKTALMEYREKSGIQGRPLWVPLKQIAPELQHAVIVAEDWKFWRHRGLDWEAIRDSIEKNWEKKRFVRGGSTITQQLAKNLYLDPSKTLSRKIKEGLITLELERHLSKARILELYLNVVEWGRGIYGAEAAARHYFGKSAAELTLEEASWLAAILPSPLRYDGWRDSRYIKERADRIARLVERRMEGLAIRREPAPPPEEPLEEESVLPGSPEIDPAIEPEFIGPPEPSGPPAPEPTPPPDPASFTPPQQAQASKGPHGRFG
jgi:monofunctional biosynthetic peptidoglycan transglycosylase